MQNRSSEVDAFIRELDHPLADEINRVREIVLAVHPGVSEVIKWKSPTFLYKGNMASFFIKARRHVSLMFHKGATIPNGSGILTGDGKEARTVKLMDMEEIDARANDLQDVVRAWIAMRDGDA